MSFVIRKAAIPTDVNRYALELELAKRQLVERIETQQRLFFYQKRADRLNSFSYKIKKYFISFIKTLKKGIYDIYN